MHRPVKTVVRREYPCILLAPIDHGVERAVNKKPAKMVLTGLVASVIIVARLATSGRCKR